MRDFRGYEAYRLGYRFTLDVYRESGGFPRAEIFGLTSQLRRAAAAIPANVAEGAGRSGSRDFARFLDIALGSANESECFLTLARDLGYLPSDRFAVLVEDSRRIERSIAALLRHLRPGP